MVLLSQHQQCSMSPNLALTWQLGGKGEGEGEEHIIALWIQIHWNNLHNYKGVGHFDTAAWWCYLVLAQLGTNMSSTFTLLVQHYCINNKDVLNCTAIDMVWIRFWIWLTLTTQSFQTAHLVDVTCKHINWFVLTVIIEALIHIHWVNLQIYHR